MLQNRYYSIQKRVDTLIAEGRKAGGLAILGRLQKVLSILKPEAVVFSAPAVSNGHKTEKPVKRLADHKTPAVGKMDFTSPVYTLSRRIVSGKIKRARRDGVQDSQNVYLRFYGEFVHVAFIAIAEAYEQAYLFNSIMPAGYDVTNTVDVYENIENEAFLAGLRACGRYAYDIEKRAKAGTPIEHVSENLKTSSFERKIVQVDAEKTFKEDVINAVLGASIRQDRALIIIQHLRENKLTDRDRMYLKQIIVKAQLVERDVSGHYYIA